MPSLLVVLYHLISFINVWIRHDGAIGACTCCRGVVNSKKYPYTPVFLMKKYEKIWKNMKNMKKYEKI
jgi:hypothetical protein